MVHQHELHPVLMSAQALHQAVDAVAGEAEDGVNAPVGETLDECFGCDLAHVGPHVRACCRTAGGWLSWLFGPGTLAPQTRPKHPLGVSERGGAGQAGWTAATFGPGAACLGGERRAVELLTATTRQRRTQR